MSEKRIGRAGKTRGCLKCGALLAHPKTGRRRVYCNRACRGAANYELRRLQRQLMSLETRRASLRTRLDDTFARDYMGRTPAQQLTAIELQIAEAETRLRLLLADAPTSLPPETREGQLERRTTNPDVYPERETRS